MILLKSTPFAAVGLAFALALTAAPTIAQEMPKIEAERVAAFGSAPEFTSADAVTNYTYDSGYLGEYVNAPLQSVQVMHFPQAPSEVFEWVHSGNAEWSLQIETLEWDHSASETPGKLGMGSVRTCEFMGGAGTAYERVYAVEENRMIAYDLDPERSTVPLPIKDFFVIWTLEDKGADGTLVVTRIYFNEAQDMGGNAAAAVGEALAVDFRNFVNIKGGTYVTM